MTSSASNLTVGTALQPFRLEFVDPEWMKTWAVALHDPNPIHLDVEVVKAKGLGDRVINQGPANLAYIINMLKKAIPGSTIESLDVRYVDNVLGGDAVEAAGSVTDIAIDASGTRITCDVWLKADARDLVIKGVAVVSIAV
ncbi:MAG: dehydratase [Verrucomicrobiaceae bacterium]|nr:dehydratase [Verrucomicrobiaceae bacterium]